VAEFEFYGDEEDCAAVATAVLTDSSYWLLANVCYEHPVAFQIRSMNVEFTRYLKINRKMFVTGPFTRGLSWQKLSEGRWAGHYVIRPEYDGPLIPIRFPGVAHWAHGAAYLAGLIDLRTSAYSPMLGMAVPPNDEAKVAFRDVVKRVKSLCRRVDVAGTRVWVGRSLLQCASLAGGPRLIVNGAAVSLSPN
jgi:hypothetical protein